MFCLVSLLFIIYYLLFIIYFYLCLRVSNRGLGVPTVPEGMDLEAVLHEAEYFCIQPLVEELHKMKRERALAGNDITKGEFHRILTR